MCVVPRDSEYLSALSRYPRERDWPDVRVLTFRLMIYSSYWYEKRLKSTLYMGTMGPHLYCTRCSMSDQLEVTKRGYKLMGGYGRVIHGDSRSRDRAAARKDR